MRGKREFYLSCGHSHWTREPLTIGHRWLCKYCDEYMRIVSIEWWTTKCVDCRYTYGFSSHASAFLGGNRHIMAHPTHSVSVFKNNEVVRQFDPLPTEPMF